MFRVKDIMAGFPSPGVKKAEDLVRNADTAMYASKKNGRNRICVFKPSYISTK
jgi:PleD family two-component response regulator